MGRLILDKIISVDGLVKIFEPDLTAVDDISFHVFRGEIFGFLGPNGAGKSTTIKILTTLLKKTSGKVLIDDLDLDGREGDIRNIIGYASQDIGVDDDLTARENLKLQCRFYHVPKQEIDGRVNEIMETVGLMEAADRKAGTYSGGMKKRLDLATSLVSMPKLLFLDEPTTGLDPQNRKAIWDYIEKLNRGGMTIFLTTQYMEEADHLANRLSIIDQGKIVAEGTPSDLKAQIGADLIEVKLKVEMTEEIRDGAIEVIEKIPGVKEVQECEIEMIDCNKVLIIFGDNGGILVPQIVRALDSLNLAIDHLTLSPPSLDDVFLKFTGRKLKVEEVKPPTRRMRRRGRK
jgi:ABC-2 type transport system ATP-binding protein